jgi:uncharacterized membrane protein YqjE
MSGSAGNGRSLAEILSEMRDELQEFAQTRIELLRRELEERAATLKAAVPVAVVATIFLGTSFLVFSFSLVAILAVLFGDNPYRWFFSSLIVAFAWAICGGSAALLVIQRIKKQPMMPRKTIEVLNGDKAWLQREVRNTL